MPTADPNAKTAPCNACGGELAEHPGEREVKCHYCGVLQPNPMPFPVGQEVLFSTFVFSAVQKGKKLGRVAACKGPDHIEIEGEKEPQRLEDLTPVIRPKKEDLTRGTMVYVDQHGWSSTWLVRADRGGRAIVKADGEAFQSNFFNRTFELNAVRLPMRASDRARRTWLEGKLQQLRSDPFGVIFAGSVQLVIGVAFLGVALMFGWLAWDAFFSK